MRDRRRDEEYDSRRRDYEESRNGGRVYYSRDDDRRRTAGSRDDYGRRYRDSRRTEERDGYDPYDSRRYSDRDGDYRQRSREYREDSYSRRNRDPYREADRRAGERRRESYERGREPAGRSAYERESDPWRDREIDRRRTDDWTAPAHRKRHGGLIALLVILLIIAGGTAFLVHMLLGKVERITDADNARVAEGALLPSGSDTISIDNVNWNNGNISSASDPAVKNILLIGQDERSDESERARSDAMILLSINKSTKKMTLVSLMRDMFVPIPDYSANKLNAAFAYGGVELLDRTIEQDFGIKIDDNVMVDLSGFLEAMTQVGDLDIELTQEEADYLNQNSYYGTSDDTIQEAWNLTAGVNSLTPSQSLAYARIRYVGNSDWDRTARQRRILSAAFNKLKGENPAAQLNVIQNVMPALKTDMTDLDMIGYGLTLMVNRPELSDENYYLPAEGTYSINTIYGMAVLIPDLQANSDYLKGLLYQ
ncbi:MAG: LCP family protein [Eubacterium sp.]|nr:LCP family protein [Eubacterium sp.]